MHKKVKFWKLCNYIINTASYTNKLLLDIEICRRACGGHGYLDYARFHDIFSEYSPFPTYEGENTVLML